MDAEGSIELTSLLKWDMVTYTYELSHVSYAVRT